ncbi:uncharacterized protein LOC128712479 [Anopheles marshallii]|uniref:uncharacterized protein LOC128712479 n=1 Tax=Anopheles marshallii TaxID=1521116 RepID=UPI00237BD46E|nr:uncharacterized protein LOC128712479 [Anopheles marshallii]
MKICIQRHFAFFSSPNSIQFRQKLTPKMWKREEVLMLLDIYEATFLQSSNESEDELWNTVSLKLNEQEIQASPAHCKSKWNLLYKAYMANPDSQGAFFKKVKQIVEVFAKMEAIDEIEEAELFKEERLDAVSEEEVENSEAPQINSDSFTVERVTESPTITETVGVHTLIEKLCRKIDALTEIQCRQEVQLEEVYKMQRANQNHLLEIKKHLNIL